MSTPVDDINNYMYGTFYPGILSCNATLSDNPNYPGVLSCNLNMNNDGNPSNDQALIEQEYEDLINTRGIVVDYYVNRYDKYDNADNMNGSDFTQKYNYPIPIRMYVTYTPGSSSLIKFGYVSDDQIEAIVLIKNFESTMAGLDAYTTFGQPLAPKAGDVIKLTNFGKTRPIGMDGKMFICTERLDEAPDINQLGGHYVWKLRFSRFRYSYEGVLDSPDGTVNKMAEARNDQTSDDDIFGRMLSGENWATENGSLSADSLSGLSAQKQYPYDVEDISERKYPWETRNNNSEWGY